MTVRSPDGGAIKADDAMLVTSKPIYKVLDFDIERYLYVFCLTQSGWENNRKWTAVPFSIVPREWYKDLTATLMLAHLKNINKVFLLKKQYTIH